MFSSYTSWRTTVRGVESLQQLSIDLKFATFSLVSKLKFTQVISSPVTFVLKE